MLHPSIAKPQHPVKSMSPDGNMFANADTNLDAVCVQTPAVRCLDSVLFVSQDHGH